MSSGDVLIIDDNPTVVTLLRGVLRDAGYDVPAAEVRRANALRARDRHQRARGGAASITPTRSP
ncbi:MAG: hypothetical protein ABIT01_18595 [Thermoanaerobaculia bacterium]